jgi:hypothetical protein
MDSHQIGLVIQFVKDCGKEAETEMVLYVCNVIDPEVTVEQVERAIGDSLAQGMFEAEKDMQRIEEEMRNKYQSEDINPLEPSETERAALLEPTPYDAGVCTCGEFVAAGKLHEHKCLTWEEKERLNDQERLAYCGWEEF